MLNALVLLPETPLHVIGGFERVVHNSLGGDILLLDDGGELREENVELQEGLFDALELVVARADVAEDGAGVACPVCAELRTVSD